MNVKILDGLARRVTCIDYNAVSALSYIKLVRNFGRGIEQVAQKRIVQLRHIIQ
jgi:hypothetical protein